MSLHDECYGRPFYERVLREWLETLEARNALPWWRVRRWERLNRRLHELSDVLAFMEANPWLLDY